jgi:hypothetical protein
MTPKIPSREEKLEENQAPKLLQKRFHTATDHVLVRLQVIAAAVWLQWLVPVIPTIWETEIGRIMDGGQPRQILCKTPFPK